MLFKLSRTFGEEKKVISILLTNIKQTQSNYIKAIHMATFKLVLT